MTGSSVTRFCAIILAAWARLVFGKQNANWLDIACSTVRPSRIAVCIAEIIGVAQNFPPPLGGGGGGAVMLPTADCNDGVTGTGAAARYTSRSWPRTSRSHRRLTWRC